MTRARPTREETRRKLLGAAFEVFSERGIAGTSLGEVAAAAGLTKGAVYSNFRSKDDLVLTLMGEHAVDRVTQDVDALNGDLTPVQAAHRVGIVLMRELRSDAGWHRLLAEYAVMAHRDPGGTADLRSRRRNVRATVATALEQVIETCGLILPMSAADFAVVILALSNGLALEADLEPDGVREDLFAEVLQIMASDAVTATRVGPT